MNLGPLVPQRANTEWRRQSGVRVDSTAIGGSAFYDFTDNFAVGALLDFDDDVTTYGVAGRFYFGR